MDYSIGSVSTSYFIRLILDYLDEYIENAERRLNFCSENIDSPVDELIGDWLEWFNEYPKGIVIEELKVIKQEIGERMGDMRIWVDDEGEMQVIVEKFARYFGKHLGFLALVTDVYKEELKDEWSYCL
ncbi:hypothetical protein [Bacillus cereus]